MGILSVLLITLSTYGFVGDAFMDQVDRDIKAAEQLARQMSNSKPTGCPGQEKLGFSACFKDILKKIPVRSSYQLMHLAKAGTQAAASDKRLGHSDETAELLMLDNVLTVLEKVQLQHLHVFHLKGKSEDDALEIDLVKNDELKNFDKSVTDLKKLMADKLKKVETQIGQQKRTPAAAAEWNRQTLTSVQKRLKALKIKK